MKGEGYYDLEDIQANVTRELKRTLKEVCKMFQKLDERL